MHWLMQLMIALDQLANVLITPFSRGAWADETLSSRAWRMSMRGKPFGRVFRPMIDCLFFWQKGHCQQAFEYERSRSGLPPELRQ